MTLSRGIQITTIALLLTISIDLMAYNSGDWRISKTTWSVTDEKNFEQFVQGIGTAVHSRSCHGLKDCLNSRYNPYRNNNPSGLNYLSDCAKLPYYLRAYFAWQNRLPFSISDDMSVRPVDGNTSNDIRYSRYGNYVASRRDAITRAPGKFTNIVTVLNEWIAWYTFSANYRTHYAETRGLLSDFYSVNVNRDSIRPGVAIYDPNGHVAVIYDVADDGRIFYIDSHPDNSLTSGTYGKKFERSNPGQGAGFKGWRPLRLVGATPDSDGNLIGGYIEPVPNNEITDFSPEQYVGTEPDPKGSWNKGQFIFNGLNVDYYDFVRMALSKGELKIEPREELHNIIDDLCNSVKDRVPSVDEAIKADIDKKDHPDRLPYNIYGTSGEWEVYSTPSRDARLKVQFKELRDRVQEMIEKYYAHDPTIVYSGSNIVMDLWQIYDQETKDCQISYTNSAGGNVTLNLQDLTKRLFLLSFDPYHCVELRWGASSPQELATCQSTTLNRKWYEREQYLRNQIDRRYDDRMDFSLEELATLKPGNGVAVPPDVDLIGYFSRASR